MFRRILIIAATLAGFAVLALLGFVLFRTSSPPKPVPPGQSAQGGGPAASAPVESPPHAPLPAAFRANTIVDFSDPDVTFMSINVDLDAAAPADAMATIAEAAHVPLDGPRGGPPNRSTFQQEVNVHLKDQPYLEALLELEAQASLNVSYDATRGYHAQYSFRPGLPGVWSVSGPFAFMLINMEHTTNVGAEGRGNGAEDTVLMQFDSIQEPGLKVLRYPMDMKVIEATDNHGNSLISQTRSPFPADGNTVRFSPRATLAYPTDNPGRRIKHFRATAKYMVQLKGETVTINDPLHALASTKTVAGIRAEFNPVKWFPGQANTSATITMTAIYHKTDDFKGDWVTLAQGLTATKPRAILPNTTNANVIVNGSVNNRPDGPVAEVNYTITIPSSFKGNPAVIAPVTEPPQFDALDIDIPSGVKQVDVPVELNDIPLP